MHKLNTLIFTLLVMSFSTYSQDNQVEGHDFYAVSCEVEFLNVYEDTVIFYSNTNKKIVCEGQEDYDAHVYYFGPNGMLMYGSQSKGETTSYKKGKYQILDQYLILTEGTRTLKYEYWMDEGNLILVRKSKTE